MKKRISIQYYIIQKYYNNKLTLKHNINHLHIIVQAYLGMLYLISYHHLKVNMFSD